MEIWNKTSETLPQPIRDNNNEILTIIPCLCTHKDKSFDIYNYDTEKDLWFKQGTLKSVDSENIQSWAYMHLIGCQFAEISNVPLYFDDDDEYYNVTENVFTYPMYNATELFQGLKDYDGDIDYRVRLILWEITKELIEVNGIDKADFLRKRDGYINIFQQIYQQRDNLINDTTPKGAFYKIVSIINNCLERYEKNSNE